MPKYNWKYFIDQGTGNIAKDLELAKQAMNKRGYCGSTFGGIVGLIWQDSEEELNKFDAEMANAGFFRSPV